MKSQKHFVGFREPGSNENMDFTHKFVLLYKNDQKNLLQLTIVINVFCLLLRLILWYTVDFYLDQGVHD